MQQFTVPQFIDVEDKIIGPLTTRQFLIALVGLIIGAIEYKIFDFSLFITCAVFNFLLVFVFAFIKINGRPFHFFMLNMIQTLKRPAIRIWAKQEFVKAVEDDEIVVKEAMPTKTINLKTSRLDQLSLMVDTYGEYRGEDLINKKKDAGK